MYAHVGELLPTSSVLWGVFLDRALGLRTDLQNLVNIW